MCPVHHLFVTLDKRRSLRAYTRGPSSRHGYEVSETQRTLVAPRRRAHAYHRSSTLPGKALSPVTLSSKLISRFDRRLLVFRDSIHVTSHIEQLMSRMSALNQRCSHPRVMRRGVVISHAGSYSVYAKISWILLPGPLLRCCRPISVRLSTPIGV